MKIKADFSIGERQKRIIRLCLYGFAAAAAIILILNSNTHGKTVIYTEKPPALDIEFEKMNAISHLNDIRKAAGLNTLSENETLNIAASKHARYLIYNYKSRNLHRENESAKGFTGKTPADRVTAAGYRGFYVTENVSSGNTGGIDSVDGLMSAIYHRFTFLDFYIDQIGIGIAQGRNDRSKSVFVYNMESSMIDSLCPQSKKPNSGKNVYNLCGKGKVKISREKLKSIIEERGGLNSHIVIYPYEDQTDVPPVFFDEIPDPLPEYEVSGFPISISFDGNYFKKVELKSFKLFDSSMKEITNVSILTHESDPNGKFRELDFALFPLERLSWNTLYRVEAVFVADGKKVEKRWSFSTKSPGDAIYIVTDKKHSFSIKKNREYIFYFKPESPHDILKHLEYPVSLSVRLVDHNTIRLSAAEEAPSSVSLKFGKHTLDLELH